MVFIPPHWNTALRTNFMKSWAAYNYRNIRKVGAGWAEGLTVDLSPLYEPKELRLKGRVMEMAQKRVMGVWFGVETSLTGLL